VKKDALSIQVKKILAPTDFSPYSTQALDYAALIAKSFKAEITLMHIIESPTYSITDTLIWVDHSEALKTTASALLENLSKELAKKGLSVATYLVTGIPYREIVKKSQQDKVDLIVMGTHGRTGMEHLLLGSVAEKVLRLAPCPVLTVPVKKGAI
jgi:universal stress protein A